jgi:hypothetical protein
MNMTRTSARKLRWTLTACLLAATTIAGALVAMCNTSSHDTLTPTAVVEGR